MNEQSCRSNTNSICSALEGSVRALKEQNFRVSAVCHGCGDDESDSPFIQTDQLWLSRAFQARTALGKLGLEVTKMTTYWHSDDLDVAEWRFYLKPWS